jgi:hypothetical protein
MLLPLRESPAFQGPARGEIQEAGKVTKIVPATNRRDPDSDSGISFVPLAKSSRNWTSRNRNAHACRTSRLVVVTFFVTKESNQRKSSRNRNPQAVVVQALGHAVSFFHGSPLGDGERNRKAIFGLPTRHPPTISRPLHTRVFILGAAGFEVDGGLSVGKTNTALESRPLLTRLTLRLAKIPCTFSQQYQRLRVSTSTPFLSDHFLPPSRIPPRAGSQKAGFRRAKKVVIMDIPSGICLREIVTRRLC